MYCIIMCAYCSIKFLSICHMILLDFHLYLAPNVLPRMIHLCLYYHVCATRCKSIAGKKGKTETSASVNPVKSVDNAFAFGYKITHVLQRVIPRSHHCWVVGSGSFLFIYLTHCVRVGIPDISLRCMPTYICIYARTMCLRCNSGNAATA